MSAAPGAVPYLSIKFMNLLVSFWRTIVHTRPLTPRFDILNEEQGVEDVTYPMLSLSRAVLRCKFWLVLFDLTISWQVGGRVCARV